MRKNLTCWTIYSDHMIEWYNLQGASIPWRFTTAEQWTDWELDTTLWWTEKNQDVNVTFTRKSARPVMQGVEQRKQNGTPGRMTTAPCLVSLTTAEVLKLRLSRFNRLSRSLRRLQWLSRSGPPPWPAAAAGLWRGPAPPRPSPPLEGRSASPSPRNLQPHRDTGGGPVRREEMKKRFKQLRRTCLSAWCGRWSRGSLRVQRSPGLADISPAGALGCRRGTSRCGACGAARVLLGRYACRPARLQQTLPAESPPQLWNLGWGGGGKPSLVTLREERHIGPQSSSLQHYPSSPGLSSICLGLLAACLSWPRCQHLVADSPEQERGQSF